MNKEQLIKTIQEKAKTSKASNLVYIFVVNIKERDDAGHEVDKWVKRSFDAALADMAADNMDLFSCKMHEKMFDLGIMKHPDPKHATNRNWFEQAWPIPEAEKKVRKTSNEAE